MNKMVIADKLDPNAISFVSRTSRNLGISALVKPKPNYKPNEAGWITVALGGAILSSFIQPRPFYTAQNIMILIPKREMSFLEKLYYCQCIESNKFRYSTFGREANRTLKTILIPEYPAKWINNIRPEHIDDSSPYSKERLDLETRKWVWYKYESLFEIVRGVGAKKKHISPNGKTPVISSTEQNNGLIGKINGPALHPGNVISVVRNGGSVASAFYQPKPFSSNEDVHIFNPRFELNPFRAMFLLPLIRKEKYRYNYGRKWGITRMNETSIKLPSTEKGEPDWVFMENYIKSLPYSNRLILTSNN